MKHTFALLAALLLSPLVGRAATELSSANRNLDRYNVVWDSPSVDAKGSMPAGNGDIGINAWVEPSGDLVFFISKSDAWDENHRLLKIGKMRVRLEPALSTTNGFQQILNLREGAIEIRNPKTEVRVWVDANHPVIQVDAKSLDGQPLMATATVELWRTEKQPCNPGYPNFAGRAFSWPDTVLKAMPKQIGWYHRNVSSPWRDNLQLQKLDAVIQTEKDPILGRTFGAVVRGDNFVSTSDTTLKTAAPASSLSLRINVLTQAEQWQTAIEKQADAVEGMPDRWSAHTRWWDGFWNRSWVFIDGDADAEAVTRAYILQRWMFACAGRGAFPIKFNGSLFVVDNKLDADYRMWGGLYWFQNTRLIYWAMLASGDLDLMGPFFELYKRVLPVRKLAAKAYYGHEGAFFPETMTIWGTFNDSNYGTHRTGKPDGLTDNLAVRRYWQGGIELVALMLDYYDFTQDRKFRDDTLLPMAGEIITFFDQHWQRGADGKIFFEPSQSLETWWESTNPLPEIAGLRYVIPRLQQIAGTKAWQKTLDDLPPLPLSEDRTRLAPAEKFANKHNTENAELYAVFPYRLYGVGLPDIDFARETFAKRMHKRDRCWNQDAIQAACLGLADETAGLIAVRSTKVENGFRFPVMWQRNDDWMPDQDHGANIMSALQRMILQSNARKLNLLPAWPKAWNVAFKLHAPYQTTVEGVYRGGKLVSCSVEPESRRADVILPQ